MEDASGLGFPEPQENSLVGSSRLGAHVCWTLRQLSDSAQKAADQEMGCKILFSMGCLRMVFSR